MLVRSVITVILYFSVGVGAFVIGMSQIASFLSLYDVRSGNAMLFNFCLYVFFRHDGLHGRSARIKLQRSEIKDEAWCGMSALGPSGSSRAQIQWREGELLQEPR